VLYSTTHAGGFVAGAWIESVLYSFTGLNGDGAFPKASVVVSNNGEIYGTTEYGGSATSGIPFVFSGVSRCGTVFELTPWATPGAVWTERVLHIFRGKNGDGALPMASLTLSSAGLLNGATSAGGTDKERYSPSSHRKEES
jgi:hypothetical protein